MKTVATLIMNDGWQEIHLVDCADDNQLEEVLSNKYVNRSTTLMIVDQLEWLENDRLKISGVKLTIGVISGEEVTVDNGYLTRTLYDPNMKNDWFISEKVDVITHSYQDWHRFWFITKTVKCLRNSYYISKKIPTDVTTIYLTGNIKVVETH